MNDEELSISDATLIARLRDEHVAASRTEAADRIEALSISNATLIAERDEAMQLLKTLSNMNGDLSRDLYKTKLLLAKAVEALEFLEIAATGSGVPHPKERELLHDCIRKARATLAEIKSHSDEFATQKGESHE